VVAEGLGRLRHIDVAANGDIYVRDRGSRGRGNDTAGGGVVALHDADADGRAEIVQRFGNHYGTGLQIRGDHLYVSTFTEVYRHTLTPGQLVPSDEAELIVAGFPEQRGHPDKAFAFDDDGHLYVNVGAPSNACQQQARTAGSKGEQPCSQRERQASVWRFDADRPGQTQFDDGYQFVRGTRNIVAIAWDETTSALYAAQHGRDSLASLFGGYFDEATSAELPSEELFRLEDGLDFGWPYCYYDHHQEKRILAPEYGGNGRSEGDCARYGRPLVTFPGHWAPNDLLFYTGNQFPERYREGAFLVFHGSWNRAPMEQAGYRVTFAPRQNGEFTGEREAFAVGFAGVSPLMSPRDAVHRPTGIAQGPDGSLYVTDDTGGTIWRILYTGD
jgi:glucose/arabinose dehydrogenase